MNQSETIKSPAKPTFFKNILNKEFVLSALAPSLIFYIFNFLKLKLIGTILSGCWCLGMVLLKLIRERKINGMALAAGGFSLIGLIGTLVLKNPMFYMAAPIFEDGLYALLFFGSLCFPRPLIQLIVEDSHLGSFPDELRRTAKYRAAWRILTLTWGVLNLTQALLRSILLVAAPLELYYGIGKIYGQLSSGLLLLGSYWFPKWYWKRMG